MKIPISPHPQHLLSLSFWRRPWGFPGGSAGKESACNEGDLDSIPGLGRSPGEETGYPLQYSGLENSMDYIAHGVAKSRTGLSDFHFHFQTPFMLPSVSSFLPGPFFCFSPFTQCNKRLVQSRVVEEPKKMDLRWGNHFGNQSLWNFLSLFPMAPQFLHHLQGL